MSLRADLDSVLVDAPEQFLRELLWFLHLSARAWYPAEAMELDDAIRGMEGLNEIGMVVAAQLRSLPSNGLAYPHEVLLDVLNEKAAVYGCAGDLRWSAEQALERIRSGD